MIHMDIDVRPPRSPPSTLRSLFKASMSSKRARSPDSASQFDRPAKRLVIGNHEAAMDSAEFSDGSFGLQASASSSRFPSEDWVRQARGLSIDNTTPYESTNPSLENLASSGDIDMMDSEDSSGTQVPYFSSGSNLSLPESRYQSNVRDQLLPHLYSRLRQPEISFTPATPSSTAPSVSSSTHDLHELRRSPSPLEASPMSMSSLTPPCGTPAQTLLRRPKFSMGPRADCEKCRLGVKGHWAHFD